MDNPWFIAIISYGVLAFTTALPVLKAVIGKIELHPGGPSFDQSPHFSDSSKDILQQNFERLRGTLGFWKKQSEIYKRLHFYILCWTIPSSVMIPFLAQASSADPYSKWLVTLISAYSAILFAVHRSFKVHENYRAFREGESNFYDTFRRMLDRPQTFGETEEIQINTYLDEVENLRKFVRNSETDNIPSLEQAKSQMSSEATKTPG